MNWYICRMESREKMPREMRPVIDNPYAVLAAVFLVTGALGIPLIWICRAWSPGMKLLITLAAIVYTGVLLSICYLIVRWALQAIWAA